MKHGKIWGETSPIEINSFASLHRAKVAKGFRCSKHLHASKWNGFFVESGVLVVRVYQKGFDDVTTLRAGEYTKVPPGVMHRFECLEDTVLFEFYWPGFEHEDIQREDVGGAID